MYGQTQTYKQIQSFGLSTNPLSGINVNKTTFPRPDAAGTFNIDAAHLLNRNAIQEGSFVDFSSFANTVKWLGGCLEQSGRYIYCAPLDATTILKIDTQRNTSTTFGSLAGTGKWAGCCQWKNFIYCSPSGTNSILRINTDLDTTSLIPTSGSGYTSAVLAPNDKIYFIPQGATAIMKLDPLTNDITYFGSLGAGNKWMGGVLYKNFIYCIPRDSTRVLKINTLDDSFTLIGNLSANVNKWAYGGLGFGKQNVASTVYGFPLNEASVLKISTDTDTVTTFGSPTGGIAYFGGCVTAGANLLAVPFGVTNYLLINTVTETTLTVPTTGTSISYIGGVLAPNGRVYAIPYQATTVKCMLSEVPGGLNRNFPLNRHFNKT